MDEAQIEEQFIPVVFANLLVSFNLLSTIHDILQYIIIFSLGRGLIDSMSLEVTQSDGRNADRMDGSEKKKEVKSKAEVLVKGQNRIEGREVRWLYE